MEWNGHLLSAPRALPPRHPPPRRTVGMGVRVDRLESVTLPCQVPTESERLGMDLVGDFQEGRLHGRPPCLARGLVAVVAVAVGNPDRSSQAPRCSAACRKFRPCRCITNPTGSRLTPQAIHRILPVSRFPRRLGRWSLWNGHKPRDTHGPGPFGVKPSDLRNASTSIRSRRRRPGCRVVRASIFKPPSSWRGAPFPSIPSR